MSGLVFGVALVFVVWCVASAFVWIGEDFDAAEREALLDWLWGDIDFDDEADAADFERLLA